MQNWQIANQNYLLAEVARVRNLLEQQAAKIQGKEGLEPSSSKISATDIPFALDHLCTTFALSTFERDILLLCVAVEFDPTVAILCASLQGDAQRRYPTFHLASVLFSNIHWTAYTSESPLRYWRLIELDAGSSLMSSPIRVDEWILHYLMGVQTQDERLRFLIRRVSDAATLVPSHQLLADRLTALWRSFGASERESHNSPVVQILSNDRASQCAIVTSACQALEIQLYQCTARSLPTALSDLNLLLLLWERFVRLTPSILLLELDSPVDQDRAIAHWIEQCSGHLVISSADRLPMRSRSMIVFEVQSPTASEQETLWTNELGAGLESDIARLAVQFNLQAPAIKAVCQEVLSNPQNLGQQLWQSCRSQARPQLDDLAQRIEATATWEDLILPDREKQILTSIATHVRHRQQVYDRWGFAKQGSRGLGISALFAGASGTGKTMAAEVIAQELQLDLYRIDLSSVVSKYIGETEKNLRRVFNAAESGSTILLFDEADALFGKRSDVKDSHDRYANMEVSYLLQRMEAYRGLAILTTNLKDSIDTAFLRRLRFVIKFPFPDAAQRREIWQRVFPKEVPIRSLDLTKLSKLNVSGGNIRNIALSAAFLAAESDQAIAMQHLLGATQSEYLKLERTLTEAEIRGWNSENSF
jgi:ATPase family associated with various cellular activities (AAA)